MPPTTRFQRLVYRTRAHTHDTVHTRKSKHSNKMVKRMRVEPQVRVKGVSIEDVRGLQPLDSEEVILDPKSHGAWRYKGGTIPRAGPELDISKYYDHKSEVGARLPRRRHESNFFITINPNLGANTREGVCDRDGLYAQLNGVLEYLSAEKVISLPQVRTETRRV